MISTLDSVIERLGLSLDSVVVLLLAAVLGFLLAIVIAFLVRRAGGFEKTRPVAAVAARCAAPMRALLPVVAMSIALSGLDTSVGIVALLPRIFSLLTIALSGWLAVRAVRGLVDYFAAVYSFDHADNLEARRMQTQIRLLGRVLIIVISIATVAGVLVSIPSIRNIGISLFASAGIAGLALGLAARPALSNIIAGIQIAITQPIRLEDAVVVEGEWGWIEEINLTFVVVRIWDLRRLVLPISYFIEKPFQNWTRTTADILGSVMLYMDYNVPLDDIRTEFGQALRASKYWDGKVEVVHVTDCTEKTMQIRLLMSAGNSSRAWELRCEVRECLIGYLQRHHPESLPRIRLEKSAGTETGSVANSA